MQTTDNTIIDSQNKSKHKARFAQRKSHMWVKVGRRDHGICALCGIDADRLSDLLALILRRRSKCHSDRRNILQNHRWAIRWDLCGEHEVKRRLWEADHIIPLSEGGEDDLGNLRTLCIPCHRSETAKLIKRINAKGGQ